MAPPEKPDNQLEENKKRTISIFGVKLYHLRTLLWTYLVWAFLNLLSALHFCQPMGHQAFGHFTRQPHYSRLPYYWVFLNIGPPWILIMSLRDGDIEGFILAILGLIAGIIVIASLFIKSWWARFTVIFGMSLWFFWGDIVLGIGV